MTGYWDDLVKKEGKSAFTAREHEAKEWIVTKISIGPKLAMFQRMMSGGGKAGDISNMMSGKPKKSINMCAGPGCGNSDFLKACAACRKVSYCSAGCQKAHWKLCHRKDCKELQANGKK